MKSCLVYRVGCLSVVWMGFLYSTAFANSYERLRYDLEKFASGIAECFPDMSSDGLTDMTTTTIDNIYPEKQLPSLNLFDYDENLDFPVFPAHDFPEGFSRRDMPQFDYDNVTKTWSHFVKNIKQQGGSMKLHEGFDLRLARPLQKEISGFIVYNIVFESLRSQFSANVAVEEVSTIMRNYFTSKIILVKSPTSLINNKGGVIDKESYFILDGHHTTYVAARLCTSPHSLLRLGNYFKNFKGHCGELFDPKQDIFVIEGIDLFRVREIALESGAGTGHELLLPSNP